MSWIKIEHGLCKSRKIAKLAAAMRWTRHQAIGFMVDFWTWAAQSCDDGQLKNITDSEIAFAAGLEKADGILKAMSNAGFIDSAPCRIHEWSLHQHEFLRAKYRRSPEIFQRILELYRCGTGAVPVQSRNKQDKQDKQDKQEREGGYGGKPQHPPSPCPMLAALDASLPVEAQAPALIGELLRLMRENDPGAKGPASPEAWERAADRLLRLDKRPLEEVRQVLAWCQHDEFWKGNILSMPKFREKYPVLRAGWLRARPKNPGAGLTENEMVVMLVFKAAKNNAQDPAEFLRLNQKELLPHVKSLLTLTANDAVKAESIILEHKAEMESKRLNWSLKSAARAAWENSEVKHD